MLPCMYEPVLKDRLSRKTAVLCADNYSAGRYTQVLLYWRFDITLRPYCFTDVQIEQVHSVKSWADPECIFGALD